MQYFILCVMTPGLGNLRFKVFFYSIQILSEPNI